MKTTFISKEANDAKFTMDCTADEFENAVVDAYKLNKDKFLIDGFRKGKAPKKIIENHYGEDVFYEEALNELLKTAYPDALDELKLEVIDSPKIDVSEVKKGSDVTFTITVPCFPEVEVKDYFGIEVEKVENKVEEADVINELEKAQKSQARLETVTDRPTENGDTVIIDFEGSTDGEKFAGGTAENFELKLGSGQFIPGFEEQLVGKNPGDDVEVVVTFPEEYQAKDLAGKEAQFKTKIHEIKNEILPEIDDDFASDVSEFETLDEYKKSIIEKLQKDADDRAESMMKDSMLEKLYEANKPELPAVMVEDEINKMVQEMEQQLSYQGLSLDQYMQYLGKTKKDIRDEAKDDAEKRVGMRVIVKAVVDKENIKATEEEIEKELEEFAAQYGNTVEDVKKMLGEANLKYFSEDVQTKKAIDTMFGRAVQKKTDEKESAANKTTTAKKTTAKKTDSKKKAEDK